MTWLWIVLAIFIYLQIGYNWGRARRRVWRHPSNYNRCKRFLCFPVQFFTGGIGKETESIYVGKDKIKNDNDYGILIALLWPLIITCATLVGVIAGCYVLIKGVIYVFTALPHDLLSRPFSKPAN